MNVKDNDVIVSKIPIHVQESKYDTNLYTTKNKTSK